MKQPRTVEDIRDLMVSSLLGTLHRTSDKDLERLSRECLEREVARGAAGTAPVFAMLRQLIGAETLTRLPADIRDRVIAAAQKEPSS